MDKYFVKIKQRRYPMSEKLEPYELKTALSYNGELEEFLLFIRNFNMNLEASGTLKSGENIQYICTLVRGEQFLKFAMLYAEVGSTKPEKVMCIILGLGTHFFTVNELSKQKGAMCRRTSKPRSLKVKRYDARLIELNKHLDFPPGAKASDLFCDEAEWNFVKQND